MLETLGCIPKTFPRVGEFLEDGDLALTGKAFAINPNPLGINSYGIPVNKPEERDAVKDTKKDEEILLSDQQPKTILTPDNNMPGGQYQARQMANSAGTRQPKGQCDPESDLPCSCPRRAFADPPDKLPMPATDSNRKALGHGLRSTTRQATSTLAKDSTGQSMQVLP